MDRRTLPSNGSVAHVSLRGKVAADRYVDGVLHRVVWGHVPLCDAPGGRRDRELLQGDPVRVLDRQGDAAFGISEKDGYVGWVEARALAEPQTTPTHRVCVRSTLSLAVPKVRTSETPLRHTMGARLCVTETGTGPEGAWARIHLPSGDAFVPAAHLRPLDSPETDPVAVAERLMGTPYLWGGNTAEGIDCSGLIQIACHACGRPCPGDSDQQERALGTALRTGTPPRRGDLLFWAGHVAWVVDDTRLLHANGHTMSVACEEIDTAIRRIEARGDGPVTTHKRLDLV